MYTRRSIEFKIFEYLETKGGSATDRELFEYLRKIFDISRNEFQHIIMSLEIEGFISARSIKEDSKIIVLKRRPKQ